MRIKLVTIDLEWNTLSDRLCHYSTYIGFSFLWLLINVLVCSIPIAVSIYTTLSYINEVFLGVLTFSLTLTATGISSSIARSLTKEVQNDLLDYIRSVISWITIVLIFAAMIVFINVFNNDKSLQITTSWAIYIGSILLSYSMCYRDIADSARSYKAKRQIKTTIVDTKQESSDIKSSIANRGW